MKKKHFSSVLLRCLVYTAAAITVGVLLFIIAYILIKGIPNISLDLFSIKYTSENGSLFPALINTITMTALSLLLAVPLGVGAAIYLTEYSKKGSRLVEIVRLTTETLSGIPSIIYGLFGSLLFVVALKWRNSILSGVFTLAIMILPLIMRTTEEALKSVADTYREGSFGLGAGKLRTIFKIVLPAASPGIFAGITLSIGRIIGETAALIYTAGTASQIAGNVMSSGRTLSVHLYMLWSEGLATEKSYATAVILLVLVIIINAFSSFIAKKVERQ